LFINPYLITKPISYTMAFCKCYQYNIDMKTKISYIILSALTLSLITGITPASAKPTATKSTPKASVAYSSPAPAKAAAAPAAKAAAIPAVIAKPPVPTPAPKPTVIPALLASYSSAVTKQATATPSYSTFSYSGPTSTAATTTKEVQPKIETIPPVKTSLPRIGSPLMAYDFIPSTSTVSKTDLNAVSSLSGDKTSSTVAQDFIKTSLIAKPSTDIKKTSTAADLTKIMTTTGLSTATLLGGKVTTYTPGQTIDISKKITTNTQYNSTDKINTTANQNEILKNVNAVTSKGLNTLLIQATADSTGKADYNLGLSQLRAETDLKNYATTMEKNGYSAKDGQWKNEAGKVVSASSCTKICTYTLKGESSPAIQLVAKGLGEVTTKSPGALGELQAKIVAEGCSNSRAGSCAALHDKQRVTLIGGVFDSSLLKDSPATTPTPPPTTCTQRGDCPPPRTTCAERGDCPPPICTVNCGTETGGTTTTTTTVNPRTTTTTVNPGTTTTTVNPGTTTTSRLPSAGGVTGGSTSTPTLPSGAGSTTSSGSSSSGSTGTPTTGVGSSSGSTSSGSTLLPPASGFGSTPTTGGSTSTPTTTSGSTSNPTTAPKFKVS
jgi:outer membrane protein OmpA-like peptidoglycan-associated protein